MSGQKDFPVHDEEKAIKYLRKADNRGLAWTHGIANPNAKGWKELESLFSNITTMPSDILVRNAFKVLDQQIGREKNPDHLAREQALVPYFTKTFIAIVVRFMRHNNVSWTSVVKPWLKAFFTAYMRVLFHKHHGAATHTRSKAKKAAALKGGAPVAASASRSRLREAATPEGEQAPEGENKALAVTPKTEPEAQTKREKAVLAGQREQDVGLVHEAEDRKEKGLLEEKRVFIVIKDDELPTMDPKSEFATADPIDKIRLLEKRLQVERKELEVERRELKVEKMEFEIQIPKRKTLDTPSEQTKPNSVKRPRLL